MRRTKIICTLGPATDEGDVLKNMMKAGMNVARFNFSHGSHEEHKARMDMVKAARAELGLPVGLMLDTKGPEIRTKTYKDGKIEIVEGQEFTLTTRDVEGDGTMVSITYPGLPDDVEVGTRILIDDAWLPSRSRPSRAPTLSARRSTAARSPTASPSTCRVSSSTCPLSRIKTARISSSA